MKSNSKKFTVSPKQYDLEIVLILIFAPMFLGVINMISIVLFKFNFLGV